MKSQEIKLTNNLSCAVEALQMVETTAAAAGLNREQVNILRLLTEEMISMTTDILNTCQGTLWLECEGGSLRPAPDRHGPHGGGGKGRVHRGVKGEDQRPGQGAEKQDQRAVRRPAHLSGVSRLLHIGVQQFRGQRPRGCAVHTERLSPCGPWRNMEEDAAQEEKFAEMEGVEKSILLGFADDVVVSVRNNWVDLTVKKLFSPPARKQMPNFTGLSHVCIFVDDMMEAVSYYQKLLGAVPDHYLSHWRNQGFFQAGGFHRRGRGGRCLHRLCERPRHQADPGADAVPLPGGAEDAGDFCRQRRQRRPPCGAEDHQYRGGIPAYQVHARYEAHQPDGRAIRYSRSVRRCPPRSASSTRTCGRSTSGTCRRPRSSAGCGISTSSISTACSGNLSRGTAILGTDCRKTRMGRPLPGLQPEVADSTGHIHPALRRSPKACVNRIPGRKRAGPIQGGSRGIRLPPYHVPQREFFSSHDETALCLEIGGFSRQRAITAIFSNLTGRFSKGPLRTNRRGAGSPPHDPRSRPADGSQWDCG